MICRQIYLIYETLSINKAQKIINMTKQHDKLVSKPMNNILNGMRPFDEFNASSISILESTDDFYDFVCRKSKEATKIFLSCLTIDPTGKCLKFFDILEDRIKNGRETQINLDKSRSMRDKNLIAILKSKSIFDNINFIDKTTFRFLPWIVNEAISVYHDKIYIFDDEVLLTGANLGGIYFENRIDRFWVVRDKIFAKSMIEKIFANNFHSKGVEAEYNEDCANNMNATIKPNGCSDLINSDTKIFYFADYDEQNIFDLLFREEYDDIFISTSYLNFPSSHLQILYSRAIKIFSSSPESRNFKNFSIFGRIISQMYTYSALKTKEYLPKSEIFEYCKAGYSYHSKGVWLFRKDFAISIIGSSNYNCRSNMTDKEAGWIFITKDTNLIKK